MNDDEFFSSEMLRDAQEEDKKRIQKTRVQDAQVNQLDERGQQGDPYATQSADKTFDEAFPGSTDPESYNYRATDEEGNLILRENVGPDGETEVVGPTRDPGRKEPGGYAPGSIQDPKVGSPLKGIADATEGVFAGMGDFLTAEVNKLQWTGMDPLPRPKNVNNELQDALRDATAQIAPSVMLFALGKKAGGSIHSRGIAPAKLRALGNDPVFKAFAETGLGVGTGLYVDNDSYQAAEDHNLAGTLKKNWPQFWEDKIPNWLATADGESADVFRHKNRMEAGGLNVGVDMIGSLARLTKASMKAAYATRWVPKNEKAGVFFQDMVKQYQESAMTSSLRTMADAAAARTKNLDDIGAYNLSKLDPDAPLDRPVKGVHDLYDSLETAMRSVDQGGIAGGMTDLARISRNAGTQQGRVRNALSSVAAKFALEPENLKRGWLLDTATKELMEAGQWDAIVANYGKLTNAQIIKTTSEVAETLLEPAAEKGFMVKILDQFSQLSETGAKTLDPIGRKAVKTAIKGYGEKIYKLERYLADATLKTQLAGQVSDFAETAVENLTEAGVKNILDEMYDRLELLLVHQNFSKWEAKNTLLNPQKFNSFKSLLKETPKDVNKAISADEAARIAAMEKIIPDAKRLVDTYRQIGRERPGYMKPFLEMLDYTNGDAASIAEMNKVWANLTGFWSKLFVDRNPEMPSMVVEAAWSNVMNSKLSAFATPLAAKIGNVGGMIQKYVGSYVGPLMSLDMYNLRRAHHALGAMSESFALAGQAYKETLWKLSTQPKKHFELMKPDVALKIDQRMAFLESMAEAALEEGNDGKMIIVEQLKAMQNMALHPLMRISANEMSASDAWTKAWLANVQARADAFDAVQGRISLEDFVNKGADRDELLQEAYELSYAKMFDENGNIADPRVNFESAEIALNNDNFFGDRLGGITKTAPILKTFFTFPRSQGNALSMFAKKYNPISPAVAGFGDELYDFLRPGKTSWTDFNAQEIQQALAKKGMGDLPVDQQIQQFIHLRHQAKARWGMGTMFSMLAVNAFLQDGITGDGHFDPKIQRAREEQQWQARSFKIPGTNKYMSYDFLGPIADVIATTINVADNWETLGEQGVETMLQKISFFLAANMEDKAMVTSFKSALDVINRDEGAINRWAAGMVNDMIPGAGQRSEWGRLMANERRELNRTMDGYFRNRNKFVDALAPEGARMPISKDWIYGRPVDGTEPFLIRVFNAYNRGMKITSEQGPEARFLTAVEYDSRPLFNKNADGVEYTPEERAELYAMVGEDGYFLQAIRDVMAKHIDSLDKFDELRQAGRNVPIDQFMMIHSELDYHLEIARKDAESKLSTRDRLQTEAWIKNANIGRAERGEAPLSFAAEQFLRDSVNK